MAQFPNPYANPLAEGGTEPGEALGAKGPSGMGASYHVVQHGDTLSAIAGKHGMSVEQLMQYNSGIIKDRNRIFPGQVVLLRPFAQPQQLPQAKPMRPSQLVGAVGLGQTPDTPGSYPIPEGKGIQAAPTTGTPAPGTYGPAEPPETKDTSVKQAAKPQVFPVEVVPPSAAPPQPGKPKLPEEMWGPGYSKPYPPGPEKVEYPGFWRETALNALPTALQALGPEGGLLGRTIAEGGQPIAEAAARLGLHPETPVAQTYSHLQDRLSNVAAPWRRNPTVASWRQGSVDSLGRYEPTGFTGGGPWGLVPAPGMPAAPVIDELKAARDMGFGSIQEAKDALRSMSPAQLKAFKANIPASDWRNASAAIIRNMNPGELIGMPPAMRTAIFGRGMPGQIADDISAVHGYAQGAGRGEPLVPAAGVPAYNLLSPLGQGGNQ